MHDETRPGIFFGYHAEATDDDAVVGHIFRQHASVLFRYRRWLHLPRLTCSVDNALVVCCKVCRGEAGWPHGGGDAHDDRPVTAAVVPRVGALLPGEGVTVPNMLVTARPADSARRAPLAVGINRLFADFIFARHEFG